MRVLSPVIWACSVGAVVVINNEKDEVPMVHWMHQDLVMRESLFVKDDLWKPDWKGVLGVWPTPSSSKQLLDEVYDAIISFYANLQGLLSGRFSTFTSFSYPVVERPFPKSRRYFQGKLKVNSRTEAFHVRRLCARYRTSIARALSRLDNLTDGSRLMREGGRRLIQVPSDVWNRSVQLSPKAFRAFRAKAVDPFFHLYAGVVAATWGKQMVTRASYHSAQEMKLEFLFRGALVRKLLQATVKQFAQRSAISGGKRDPVCPRAVEIGFGSGQTTSHLLQSVPCLQLLSVDIQAKPQMKLLRQRFKNPGF